MAVMFLYHKLPGCPRSRKPLSERCVCSSPCQYTGPASALPALSVCPVIFVVVGTELHLLPPHVLQKPITQDPNRPQDD